MGVGADTHQHHTVAAKSEAQLKRLRKINATVIPAPRKSVKRMMLESLLQFMPRLFSSQENPPNQDHGCLNVKRISPYGSQFDQLGIFVFNLLILTDILKKEKVSLTGLFSLVKLSFRKLCIWFLSTLCNVFSDLLPIFSAKFPYLYFVHSSIFGFEVMMYLEPMGPNFIGYSDPNTEVHNKPAKQSFLPWLQFKVQTAPLQEKPKM